MLPAGSAVPTRCPPSCTATAPHPIHISLPGHETLLALRTANALLAIDVNGTSQLALPKQVQRDPIKHTIEHVDLVIVRHGEKVTVDVLIVIEGEAGDDTLVVVDRNSVPIEAEATHIPERIVVSVEDLPPGTQILASDLKLPEGSTLAVDPDTLIVNMTNAPSAEAIEAELAEAEAEAGIEPTLAEPRCRGIRRGCRATRARARQRLTLTRTAPWRPGSWSGWATPVRPTSGTGTTSATSWSTISPGAPVAPSRRSKAYAPS